MWEINNNLQILGFLRSVALGGIFCVLYDILRSLRKTFRCSDFSVFWQDIFYFTLCAPVTFCFLLAITNGELRAYVFFAIMLGFVVIRLTLSFLILRILNVCFLVLKKVYLFVCRLFEIIIMQLNKVFTVLVHFFEKIFKKVINSYKKVLKKQ
jgi:spore cortex biosynthesis protein YabQ